MGSLPQHCTTLNVLLAAEHDYNSTSGITTFTPGANQQTINIPIINDLRLEDNETFTVQLTNAPARVTLDPAQATVTILDDDGK